MEKTVVIFRKYKDGTILALFPYEPYNHDPSLVMCYEHTGQHGGAHYDHCIKMTRPAKFPETVNLQKELTSIGYNLNIRSRKNYKRS